MSITSRINEMSTHIEQAYDELQGLGADLTNVNKNIENISMVLDDIYDSMPQVSGEGTSLTLDDTRVGKIKSTLKGNTSQTTYSGKNLLPNERETDELNGITVTKRDDGTYLVNGTASADVSMAINLNTFIPMSGTWRMLGCPSGGSASTYMLSAYVGYWGEGSPNIDTGNGTNITYTGNVKVRFYIKSGTTCNNLIFKPMLTTDTSTTINDFEPYTGGQASPNPDYPQEVHVVSGDNEIIINSKNQLETYNISGTFNGVSYTLQDGVLTLNGTCTSTGGLTGLGIFRQIKGINYKWTYVYESGSCTDYGGGLFMGATPTSTTAAGYGAGFRTNQSRTVGTFNNGEEHTYYLYMSLNNNSTYTNYKIKPLIVQGDEYSYDFEPYQGNTYNIDLPVENLFDKSVATTGKGVNVNTGFLYNETATFATDYIEIQNNTTYIPSGYSSSSNRVYGAIYDSNKSYLEGISTDIGTKKFTISNANAKYIRLTGFVSEIDTWQLELGSKVNSYTPYGTTPIELCKIGNYQDYFYKDSDKWYLHKEIGKVVLNGSENWSYNSSGSYFVIYNPISDIDNKGQYSSQTLLPQLISNYYTPQTWQNFNNGAIGFAMFFANNTLQMRLSSSLTSVDAFKSWLGTNQPIFKYILATPTNTEITYQPLIDQLNLLEKAMSKDGQTNISQVNNDLPFIISASALKEWQENTSLNSTLSMVNPLSLGNTLNTQDNDIQPIEVDNIEPLEEEENEES